MGLVGPGQPRDEPEQLGRDQDSQHSGKTAISTGKSSPEKRPNLMGIYFCKGLNVLKIQGTVYSLFKKNSGWMVIRKKFQWGCLWGLLHLFYSPAALFFEFLSLFPDANSS